MERLDLHGTKHEDVEYAVIRFLEGRWGSEEVEIITGRSPQMRGIVEKVLQEYDLHYQIGGPLAINNTFIRIHLDY